VGDRLHPARIDEAMVPPPGATAAVDPTLARLEA
jgi:hypothetical protein